MDVTEIFRSNNDDSSDSDIVIVKQIKPVSRITLQDALIIKHNVLNTAKSKNQVKNKKNKNNRIKKKSKKELEECTNKKKDSSQKSKKSSGGKSTSTIISNDDKIVSKDKQVKVNKKNKKNSWGKVKQTVCTGVSVDKSTPSKITDCLTENGSRESEKYENVIENVQLSPGISKRRKRFKINDGGSTSLKCRSPVKKSLIEAFSEVKEGMNSVDNEINYVHEDPDNCSLDICEGPTLKMELDSVYEFEVQNSFTNALQSVDTLNKESIENNGEYLSFILKNIINIEMKKQNERENLMSENGIKPEKLLSRTEENTLKQFLQLNKKCATVLVRMLCRKKSWHRVSTLNLKDLKDCSREFSILSNENLVDINIEVEDIRTQLNLLSRMEVLTLCKKFNVFSKSASSNKKKELINSLIQMSTNQKSVLDMLSKTNCNHRLNLLKSELKKCLGMCVRLSKATLSAFNKIILLFSFAHYTNEESKRFSDQLFMCYKVFKNMMTFPSYKLSPCVVFETKSDFEEYEKALTLQHSFEIATANKEFDDFTDIAKQAEVEFRRLLSDEEYLNRFLRLKPFLKKFSGGTVYAKVLTSYCTLFKTQTESTKIISVAQLLLDQNLFLTRKKGQWYEALSKALESQKKMNAASGILIKGISDPSVNEVQKLTLQLRGQLILKRKSNGVDDAELREALDIACTVEVQEPPSIEITGQAVQGNERGFKCVYVEQNGNGKVYSSVEEKAISYYRSHGYTRGFHVEGFIVHSMYFLFFYEIIYEMSPVGVFQTPYQEAPLDFYSSSFYINRQDEIDALFSQMLIWSDAEIEEKLNDVYYRNIDTTCLITWTEGFTPDLFCELLKCLTMPLFVNICRRLVTGFASVRSGFPDLTLWDPATKKCKFVEVKSPKDKLSPAQRIWLDFLRNIGVDCEVCNVKNIGGKKFRQ